MRHSPQLKALVCCTVLSCQKASAIAAMYFGGRRDYFAAMAHILFLFCTLFCRWGPPRSWVRLETSGWDTRSLWRSLHTRRHRRRLPNTHVLIRVLGSLLTSVPTWSHDVSRAKRSSPPLGTRVALLTLQFHICTGVHKTP